MNENLLNSKGKDVKVAVIDSGVSEHEFINSENIIENQSVIYEDKEMAAYKNVEDENGHGTAVAGIISREIPEAKLCIIKILDKENSCSGKQLIEALEKALDLNVDIVNLSLGTERWIYKDRIKKLIKKAYEKKICIVTASNNKLKDALPYNLDKVFKVLPGTLFCENKIYYKENEFLAQALPKMLPWINNTYCLVGGSSFAAPRVTAILGKLIAINGRCEYGEMLELLKKHTIQVQNKNLIERNIDFRVCNKPLIENVGHIYKSVYNFTEDFLGKQIEEKPLWMQGIWRVKAYNLLKNIENRLNIKINFSDFNIFDFYSVTSITNKLNSYIR